MYSVGIACVRDTKRDKENVQSVIVLLELTIIIDYIFPHEEKSCKSRILFSRSVIYLYLQMHFFIFLFIITKCDNYGNTTTYFPYNMYVTR